MPAISLRPATLDDTKTIYKWRNDPWIVSLSSLRKTVSWDEHKKWFEQALSETKYIIYIIEIDGVPAGQIRFENIEKENFIITIYLMKPFTGKGYGENLIKQSCNIIRTKNLNASIYAFIQKTNKNSISAFSKAGFNIEEKQTYMHLTIMYVIN